MINVNRTRTEFLGAVLLHVKYLKAKPSRQNK